MARCMYCCHCGKCGSQSYRAMTLAPGTCPFCGARSDARAQRCSSCGKPLPQAPGSPMSEPVARK